jgi:long-chain acyl-CoA synthetase
VSEDLRRGGEPFVVGLSTAYLAAGYGADHASPPALSDAGGGDPTLVLTSTPAGGTLDDVLDEHAGGRTQSIATVCASNRANWPTLAHRVAAAAGMLRQAGVSRGDRVAWLAQNCHRYLETLLACARLDAIFCPLNWRMSPREAARTLDDIDPTVVVWQNQELSPLVNELRAGGAVMSSTWIGHDDPGPDGYEARAARSDPTASRLDGDPDTPVLLLYTAAFDGQPNGALLSQQALLIQALYGMLFGGATAADVYLNCGPLFHVGTLKTTLATFLAGGTNVFVPRVEPRQLCETIDREHCTGAFLQPPTIDAIVDLNRDGRFDLSSLRAKHGPEAWNAMISPQSDGRYRSGYGQTELGGVVTFIDREAPCIGSAGRPGPLARMDIIDTNGHSVVEGDVGEIVVRGPMTMSGYHRRPELTATRARGGWHHTNDLGRRETDGSISFIGPCTRIIKSAAENIYPAEVEQALRQHPAVADAAVIGTPDATWGQRVLAVVAVEGAPPTAQALIEHCRDRIASYKKPSAVVFVDEVPRRDGAIDYDALDERFGGGGYPGSGVR